MELSNYSLDGMEKSLDLSLLTFPEKLWELVNDSSCKEIVWSHDGKSLVIPSIQNFISEVLNNPAKPIFKTKNFSSFVRQLNLYGFRKMSTESRKYGRTVCSTKCQFKHPSFIKGERGEFFFFFLLACCCPIQILVTTANSIKMINQ